MGRRAHYFYELLLVYPLDYENENEYEDECIDDIEILESLIVPRLCRFRLFDFLSISLDHTILKRHRIQNPRVS